MEQEFNSKVQKINEEDYEIIKVIESKGRVLAVNWYVENYECNLEDAVKTIYLIRDKYNVKCKEKHVPNEEELFDLFQQSLIAPKVGIYIDEHDLEKWYMETSGSTNLEETLDILNKAIEKYKANRPDGGDKSSSSSSGSGCVVTLLIAITSTLSLMFFIL